MRVHPDYDGDATHGADIALVRLSSPVTEFTPIEPVGPGDRSDWQAGDGAQVLGWGVTEEDGTEASEELRWAGVPIHDDADMAVAYGEKFKAVRHAGCRPVSRAIRRLPG